MLYKSKKIEQNSFHTAMRKIPILQTFYREAHETMENIRAFIYSLSIVEKIVFVVHPFT